MRDSSETVGCCSGDIGTDVVCGAGGTLSCAGSVDFPASQFQVYYGADCTRACGPCSIACPIDAGPHADGGADAN